MGVYQVNEGLVTSFLLYILNFLFEDKFVQENEKQLFLFSQLFYKTFMNF